MMAMFWAFMTGATIQERRWREKAASPLLSQCFLMADISPAGSGDLP
jgi:hypothetical protein